MTPERWQRVKEIVQSALAKPPSERALLVAEACRDDAEAAREVASLLQAHDQAGSFIDTPAFARPDMASVLQDLQAGAVPSWTGRRIGPYVLVRELGHGGMGAVYLATRADDEYLKEVAIKIVQSTFASAFIQERFRHERQILADLDHPNIARLIDGGSTTDGTPYFVMEYVDGLPIDRYCEVNQLSIDARLRLFLEVCAAVNYAHQHLVVHRDLKAGNILVTASGTAKLLDFGIAKFLDADVGASHLRTATAMRVMTLESASPEQVRGGAITTASDVYGLGVLLYRLLTGRGPRDVTGRTASDLAQEICDSDVRRPSDLSSSMALARRLRGDLDTIVMKALQNDPARRYGTADEFAQDVSRYLGHLPVLARADTVGYRAVKFVRRHAVGVSATALIAATLAGGVAATGWQAHIARVQRGRAERRFNDVRKLANSFLFEFHDAIKDLPGSTKARELVVLRALEYLDGLSSEASNDASLQRELAASYERVGDVQGLPEFPNLGNTAGALRSHQRALSIRQALAAANGSDLALRRDLVRTHSHLSAILAETGQLRPALAEARDALAIREALRALNPAGLVERNSLAISYHEIGGILSELGDWNGALENYQQETAAFEALRALDPASAAFRRNASLAHKRLGGLLERNGDRDAALGHYRQAIAIDEARVRDRENDRQAQLDLSYGYASVGYALSKTGDTGGALDNYGQALSWRERAAAADPRDVNAQDALARAHVSIGRVLADAGRVPEALVHERKALAMATSRATADSSSRAAHDRLADAYSALAAASARLAATATNKSAATRHWQDARGWSQKGVDIWAGMIATGTLSALSRKNLDAETGLMAGYEKSLAALDRPGPAPVR